MHSIVRFVAALALAAILSAAPAHAVDSGDIVVASVKGEVHIVSNGTERALKAGAVLEPPVSVRTGRSGTVVLKQGATSINIGPDTDLEFPALEKRGAPIDRIVQPRGNAFYDIGKREGRRLRVETPYLVGVVKGTQFNVAAQADSTSISLFEGRLEIVAPDAAAIVDLHAGEIAARKRGDSGIGVVKMEPGQSPPQTRAPAGGARNDGSGSAAQSASEPRVAGNAAAVTSATTAQSQVVAESRADDAASIGAAVSATVRTNPDVVVGSGTLELRGDNPASGVAAGVGASAAPAVTIPNVDPATPAIPNSGPASVDTPAAQVTVGAGSVTVDLGANANVDLGNAPAVDTGAGSTVDVGANTVTVNLDAAADVSAGALNSAAGAGNVDLAAGLGLSGVDTAAPDTSVTDPGNSGNTPAPANPDVGGVLDSLVRNPGRP